MFDPRNSDEVLDALGSKVVEALGSSIALARQDFAVYRTEHPAWVADATQRGVSNWLHDRILAHLTRLLEDVPNASISGPEPTRELSVGVNFRIRVKRHDGSGATHSYPTQTALDFLAQPSTPAFPEMDEVRLQAGYVWDKVAHDVGPAVLSFRDGQTVIWMVELEETVGTAADSPTVAPWPSADDPTSPGIVIDFEVPSEEEDSDSA
jgi:hypothetical protein